MYIAIAALVAVAVFCVSYADDSYADDTASGEFVCNYDDDTKTATIVGYTPADASKHVDLVIPSTIGEYKVTAINEGAFMDVKVDSYSIDGTIEGYSVHDGALYKDSSKTLLAYPIWAGGDFSIFSGTTKIAAYAFANPSISSGVSLNRTIDIPSSVVEIGTYAFKNLSLNTIIIRGSDVTFGDYAFAGTFGYYSGGTTSSMGDIVLAGESQNFINLAKAVVNVDSSSIAGAKYTRYIYAYDDLASVEFDTTLGKVSIQQLPSADGDEVIPVSGSTLLVANKYTYVASTGTLALVSLNGCYTANAGTVYYGLTYDVSSITLSQDADDDLKHVTSLGIGAKVTSIDFSKLLKMVNVSKVTLSSDNANFSLDSDYRTHSSQKYYNYTILDKDQTTIYAFLVKISDTYTPTSYTVPKTVTTIGAGAFANASMITTFDMRNSLATVSDDSFGPMKFYEADESTIIPANDVPGGYYTGTNDKLVFEVDVKIGNATYMHGCHFQDSVSEINIPCGDTYTMNFVSSPNRLVSKFTFDADSSLVTVDNNMGVLTFTAGSTVGTATVTASYDYTYGDETVKFSAKLTVNVVNSEKVGTKFYDKDSSYNYEVVAANQVNVINPNSNKIPATVTCNDASYEVVGVSVDVDLSSSTMAYSVDSGNKYLVTDSYGALYSADMKTLYAYPVASTTTSYVMPNTVETVKMYAFRYAYNLTSIEISSSLVTVEEYAFQKCSMPIIVFPETVKKVGNGAFDWSSTKSICFKAKDMSDVDITVGAFSNVGTGSSTPTTKAVYVYDKDFTLADYKYLVIRYMPSATGDTLSYNGLSMVLQYDGSMTVTSIASGYSSYYLTEVTYGCQTYPISSVNVTDGIANTNLVTVTIGASVESINASAFSGFTKIRTITVNDNSHFSLINGVLVDNDNNVVLKTTWGCTDFAVSDSVTTIADNAVIATSLKNISFPSSLTTIGTGNFSGLKFVDADMVEIEATAANLAGCSFYVSTDDSSTMVLDDDSVVITFVCAGDGVGTISTSTLRVPIGSTITTQGDTIAFSKDGEVKKTFTATATVEHGTCIFSSWSSTSGTVSDAVTIMANFIVENEVTVKPLVSEYGSIDGESSVKFNVPYGTTYSSNGTVMTFTYNGNVLKTVTAVPTQNTAQYAYAFFQWTLESGTVTEDIDVIAAFTQTVQKYTVSIYPSNSDLATINGNSDIQEVTCEYGTTYSVSEDKMTFTLGDTAYVLAMNTAPEHRVYKLVAWLTEGSTGKTITGETNIIAQVEDTPEMDNVTIVPNDKALGKISYSESVTEIVEYGTKYSVSGNKLVIGERNIYAIPATAPTGYVNKFVEWSVSEGTVGGDMTITATFAQAPIEYNVTFASSDSKIGIVTYDGKSVESESIAYGTVIAVDGSTITIGDKSYQATPLTTEHYVNSFVKWNVNDGKVEGDMTIIATFEQVPMNYKVTIESSDTSIGVVNDSAEPIQLTLAYGTTYSSTMDNKYLLTLGGDSYTAKITGTAPEHRVYKFDMWVVEGSTNGTITGETTITAKFSNDIELDTVTIITNDPEIGRISYVEKIVEHFEYGTEYTIDGNKITIGEMKYSATLQPASEGMVNKFVSWSVDSGTVDGDMTITATFRQEVQTFKVTIEPSNANVATINGISTAQEVTCNYGTKYSVSEDKMTFTLGDTAYVLAMNTAPEHRYYVFGVWEVAGSENGVITDKTTVTAVVYDNPEMDSVNIVSNDTTIGRINYIDSEAVNVEYGTKYSVSGNILTLGDERIYATLVTAPEHYVNSFVSWSVSEGTVEGNMTITATFAQVPMNYKVTFATSDSNIGVIVCDGTAVDQASIAYGTTIAADGATITIGDKVFTATPVVSGDSNVTNSFVKFDGITSSVAGDMTITATFQAKVTGITVDDNKAATVKTSSDSITLDADVVAKAKENADKLTVETGVASLSFDKNAISKIGAADLKVTNVTTIPDEVKGAKKVIEIDFGSNHDFSGGNITVTTYIEANLDMTSCVVGYVHDGKVDKVDATYDKATGKVTFTVNHLSTFAVLDSNFFPAEKNSDNTMLIVAAVIVVVVVLAAAFFLMKTGKISFGKKN